MSYYYSDFVTIFTLEQDFNALRQVDWLGDSMNVKFLKMRADLADAIEEVKYIVEEAFSGWHSEHTDPEVWARTWMDGGIKHLVKYDMQIGLGWRFNVRDNMAKVLYELTSGTEMRCPSCFIFTEESECPTCGCLTEDITLDDVDDQIISGLWDHHELTRSQVHDILVEEAYPSWWCFVTEHSDVPDIARRAKAAMDLFEEADEAEGDEHIALWISALSYAINIMHVGGYILEPVLNRSQIESLHAMVEDH